MFRTVFYLTAGQLLLTLGHVSSQTTLKVLFSCSYQIIHPIYVGYQVNTTIGALAHSLEIILANSTLLPGYTFSLRYSDSDCNSKDSLGGMVAAIDDGFVPDIAIGPLCSAGLSSLAMLTSLLNVPTLSWASTFSLVRDKSIYTTLVRSYYAADTFGQGVLELIKVFSWKRLCLISEATLEGDLELYAKSIYDIISSQGDEYFIHWIQHNTYPNLQQIQETYREAKTLTRVIVLSIDSANLDNWMLAAYNENMHRGDFVLILATQVPVSTTLYQWITASQFAQSDGSGPPENKSAYQSLFMLTYSTPDTTPEEEFFHLFNDSQFSSRWAGEIGLTPEYPHHQSIFVYDVMMLYASIATHILMDGGDLTNGTEVFQKARNYVFQDNLRGTVAMDDVSDRVGNFWLFDLQPNGTFSIIAESKTVETDGKNIPEFEFFLEPIWGDGVTTGRSNAPPDIPQCGFSNEKCDTGYEVDPAVVVVVVFCCAVVCVISLELAALILKRVYLMSTWKVNYEEITILNHESHSVINQSMNRSRASFMSGALSYCNEDKYGLIAFYKGIWVTVKEVRKSTIDLDEEQIAELQKLVRLNHQNVNVFVGVSVDPPNICALWQFCSKGSLQDIIAKEMFFKLNETFKFSIALDILTGLQYLHKHLEPLGNLCSNNVVLDNRYRAKITDFGLFLFSEGQEADPEINEEKAFQLLYWTAPENLFVQDAGGLLSYMNLTLESFPRTRAGDMYSVGIIFKEIFCRNEPYELEHCEGYQAKDIIKLLLSNRDFRPSLEEMEVLKDSWQKHAALKNLIRTCWRSEPEERPTVAQAIEKLLKISPKETDVMDQMVSDISKHTKELERRVTDITMALREEKEKCDHLLQQMLPGLVMDDLLLGKAIEPEFYESITICISEVVGFVDTVLTSTPEQVMCILHKLHRLLDNIVRHYDIYKVSNVGDIYVVASGLPNRNGTTHVARIANFCLNVLNAMYMAHESLYIAPSMQLRMGMHTGAIVAGVVGLTVPRYDLFGDTVNTASRMMATSKAMRIHMSEFAFEALSKFGGYHVADRGFMAIKGKGVMRTFWLYGKEFFPMPSFDDQFSEDLQKPVILPMTKNDGTARDIEFMPYFF